MATTKATNLGHRSDVTLKGTTTTIETDVVVSDTTTINNAGSDVGLKINSESTGHIMQLQDNGTDVMVVEDGGNVGLGTADPEELLHLNGTEAVIKLEDSAVTGEGFIDFDGSSLQLNTHRNPNTGLNPNSKAPASIVLNGTSADSSIRFATKASNSGAATERMAIDKDGSITTPNGEFNGTIGTSASGSANLPAVKTALNASGSAPIYACRAWVHFDGTVSMTVNQSYGPSTSPNPIHGSGNVSSITDLGTGLYTCNFATSMDDEHYVITCGANESAPSGPMVADRMILVARGSNAFSTSGASVHCRDISAATDRDQNNICVAIFR